MPKRKSVITGKRSKRKKRKNLVTQEKCTLEDDESTQEPPEEEQVDVDVEISTEKVEGENKGEIENGLDLEDANFEGKQLIPFWIADYAAATNNDKLLEGILHQ